MTGLRPEGDGGGFASGEVKKQRPLMEVRCFFIGPAYLIMMGEVDLYIISPFHSAANARLLFIGITAAFRLEAQTGSGKPFRLRPAWTSR